MTRRRSDDMRSVVRVVVTALIAMAVAGCAGGDTSLYVRNDSQASWYLSVVRTSGRQDLLWVVRVAPGADGFALSWRGGESVPVTVLALDCSPVGVLEQSADGTWAAPAAPGLTARIEHHPAPLGSTTPGFEDTEDCGGFLAG